MKIAFLACDGTMPGSPTRRDDASEHDWQVAALRAELTPAGIELVELDWQGPLEAFAGVDHALLGTVWNYQDCKDEFLNRLDALSALGMAFYNPPEVVRWNIDKGYLHDLAKAGAHTIPTLWFAQPNQDDVKAAFDHFNTDCVVAKRRVGAGAQGQCRFHRGDPALSNWHMDRPGMIQPYFPAIVDEGEYSFIFVDGNLSHCLRKTAKIGDYRIQSLYGGIEQAVTPSRSDLAAAQAIVEALPFPALLYARIDMVRGGEGQLHLMEAELIEPYLYPLQGPELGIRMCRAIMERLGMSAV